MKTIQEAPTDDGDVNFQSFLNKCGIDSDLCSSTVSFPSALDRFKMNDPQFEKQKKSKFKQRTLQRNAGFIKAGRMKGNVGGQSLDELLRFINGDEDDRVAAGDKKLSLKAGKGLQHDDTHLKIQSVLNGEIIPDSLDSVVIGEKLGEIGSTDSDESESDVMATRVELPDCVLNDGSTSSEAVKEEEDVITETVVVAASSIFGGEFKETEAVNSGSAAECIICVDAQFENSTGETGVEDATFESNGTEFSRQRKDIVDSVELPSISSSRSDGAETVKSSDDENNDLEQTDRFIVVQKRKRNRLARMTESKSGRESPTSSVFEFGSKAPTQGRNRARDTLSMFMNAKLGNSKFSSSNREYFHRPWAAVYRDKNRRRSELTLRCSDGENSTCSVPILTSTTPSFVINDETDVKCTRTNVAETNFRSDSDRRNSTHALKNCDTPNNTPVAGTFEGDLSNPIASEARTSENCGADLEPVVRHAKISSNNSSSNTISSRPVVFLDARHSPTEKIDVTFGFDADLVSASKCNVSDDLVGGSDLPVATSDQNICMPDSQYVNGYYECCCLPCINQFFDETMIARSSVNVFSNHMHPAVTSHLPVACDAYGSYPGFPYALPASIPVGIVPPYIVYDYGQVNSASADFPTYEDVNNETLSLSKSDFSASDVCEIHACEKESFEDKLESCSADVGTQPDSAVSNVTGKRPNVFHLADAQRFLLRDFQGVISQCTQFNPDSK